MINFVIEKRGELMILVWHGDNGCHIATRTETAMWKALPKAVKDRAKKKHQKLKDGG